jgi:hypothetical protein
VDYQNAFDVGSCTVQVWDNQANQLYSGVMAKGDSHDFTNPLQERALTISVDGVGSVSLSSATVLNSLEGYNVYVFPSYSMGNSGIRLISISFEGGVTGAAGLTDPNGVFSVDFDSVSPASPDPMDLSLSTDQHLCWGVFAVKTGG